MALELGSGKVWQHFLTRTCVSVPKCFRFDPIVFFAHVRTMEFKLSPSDLLARARSDLRMGVPIVLNQLGTRVLVLSAETTTQTRLDEMRAEGDVVLAITSWRANTLKARAYDGDLARISMPAQASLKWVHAMADPSDDLAHPMKGPFDCLRDGDAAAARGALSILKSAQLLPAAILAPTDKTHPDLTEIALADLVELIRAAPVLQQIVSARLPVAAAGETHLHIFRQDDGAEEHYAIEVGIPARDKPVLTRVHSACFTGDILGSLKCDCGPQLNGALGAMGAEGSGVLLYLNQEGRGIGLVNKMRAYSLQDQGFDTVEANHRLGFEDDERDFRIGAEILRKLGFRQVRLMTNNPNKVEMLNAQGISVVQRVPLKIGENPLNAAYLATKAEKSGHML